MNDDSQTATQKKIGRPRKPSNRTKGAMVWVTSDYIELVNAYLDFLKQHHPHKQAKQ
jgi:hypothetical protein